MLLSIIPPKVTKQLANAVTNILLIFKLYSFCFKFCNIKILQSYWKILDNMIKCIIMEGKLWLFNHIVGIWALQVLEYKI